MWSQLSPSSTWVMEIELMSSGLATGAFAHGANSPAPKQIVFEGYSSEKIKIAKEGYSSNTLKVDKRFAETCKLAPLISQNCREIHKTVGCSQFQTPNRHLRVLKSWTICSNRCICIFVLCFISPHMALYYYWAWMLFCCSCGCSQGRNAIYTHVPTQVLQLYLTLSIFLWHFVITLGHQRHWTAQKKIFINSPWQTDSHRMYGTIHRLYSIFD